MNENVTIKTPKRRRWIARFLVSALCILLASSLLFVTVVAANTNSIVRETIDQSSSDSKSYFGYHFSSDGLMGVTECSVNPSNTQYIYIYKYGSIDPVTSVIISISNLSAFGGCSSGDTWVSTWHYDGSVVVVNIWDYNGNRLDFDSFSVSDFSSFYGAYGWGYVSTVFYNGSNLLVNIGYNTSSGISRLSYLSGTQVEGSFRYPIFDGFQWVFYTDKAYVQTDDFSVLDQENSVVTSLATTLYFGNTIVVWLPTGTKYIISFSNGYVQQNSSLPLTGRYGGVYLFDILLPNFQNDLVGFGVGNDSDTYYSMYATSSEYVPPESSDETTTEPPPESSEESSEPDVTMTKIWKYEPGSGGTSVSSVIGEVDLNDAVKVEAFLGRAESSPDNPYWTDMYQNLMIRVTNSDDTEDIYEYDFPAYGYYSGLLSSEVEFSDFVFPGFVGYWFEIPFENGSEISFATKSPGGSVFLYGYNMQLTVNFNSPDSSFRLLFGQDSYSVVLSNIGENSQIVVFEDETVLRYKKFTVNGGSSWYAPEEGTFALFPASDVLDPNILLSSIRIETNVDNTLGFPTESFLESVSKWEEYLSRQEDKQDFLNSLAGDAYDQISIDPDTSEAYGDAVDTFSTVVNSEGGSVIFGFFRYMWSVHPLMSSMASLVVTFAIVGFVVRKV